MANTGPSDASAPLTVTDVLPSYQTFVSASGPWTCTADAAPNPPTPGAHQTVTCALASVLAAGASAPGLGLVVLVDATAPAGDEANTATATSPTPGSPGTDSATVTITRVAALTVTKTHSGNGQVGQPLDFTLVVHNSGPSAADQVEITDPLPAGLSYDSYAGTGWSCSAVGADVTCDLAGTLASGADSTPLTLTAIVGAAAYPGVANIATVQSTDPTLPGSSSATDPVAVDPSAQLTVVKQHLGTFTVGGDGSYEITVTNSGPTATPGPTTVVDTLPGGLTFVSGSGTGWTCSAAGQTVSCVGVGAIAVGGVTALTLTVAVGPGAYPSVVNSATASAPGAPPASGTDTAPVTPLVRLGITKTVTSYTQQVVTYAIRVTNQGPNDSVGTIRVRDTLSAGLAYRWAGGPGWSCASSANTVTCLNASSLPVGVSSTVTLVARVVARPGSTVINVAGVSGGGVLGETLSRPASIVVSAIGGLPHTGADVLTPVRVAVALLVVGTLLLLAGRLRRRPSGLYS